MGLAEAEWLELVLYPNEIMIYEDFVLSAKKICNIFKEAKCDFIIALTHMRTVFFLYIFI